MNYKRLIALLMVCAYLILPLDSFAKHESTFASPLQSDPSTQIQKFTSIQEFTSIQQANSNQECTSIQELAPLGESDSHCPCSERHGSDGCNSNCSCCSCCSFFAPLPTGIAWRPLQATVSFSMLEPFKRFPEVYLPIFVPPQNLG
jgi:hypothetical protein